MCQRRRLEHPSLRDRRQPRPVGRLALSLVSSPPLFARPPISTATTSGPRAKPPTRRRDRRTPAHLSRALSRRTCRRGRTHPRASRLRHSLRLSLDPVRHSRALFEGTLPIFNIGTNHGATCAPAVEDRDVWTSARTPNQPDSTVLNGRFTGGWTTRDTMARPKRVATPFRWNWHSAVT